jgi:hypothetical protein
VQVWEKSGAIFQLVEELKPTGETGFPQFGAALATDGTSLFIGGPKANNGGAVWVASTQGGKWLYTSKIPNSIPGASDFGTAVALDGDRLAVLAAGINSGVQALGYSKQGASWSPDAQPISITPAGGSAAQAPPILSMALGGGHLLVGPAGARNVEQPAWHPIRHAERLRALPR